MVKARLTFIDLFCGCGGFSLGLERAGFTCVSAIDFNKEVATVFQHNFPHVRHALHKDLTNSRLKNSQHC